MGKRLLQSRPALGSVLFLLMLVVSLRAFLLFRHLAMPRMSGALIAQDVMVSLLTVYFWIQEGRTERSDAGSSPEWRAANKIQALCSAAVVVDSAAMLMFQ